MPAKPWKRGLAKTHLVTLLKLHDIKATWISGPDWLHKSESWFASRMVTIPKPYTPQQYLVALHEIGHILAVIRWADRTGYPVAEYKLMYEAAAWGWAVEHIHPQLDQRMPEKTFLRIIGEGFASHAWDLAVYAEL